MQRPILSLLLVPMTSCFGIYHKVATHGLNSFEVHQRFYLITDQLFPITQVISGWWAGDPPIRDHLIA